MLVIADTSPLHYLVLIEQTDILPALFGHVIIPPVVAEELQRARTPAQVRAWMASPPAWLDMRPPQQPLVTTTLRLGACERETLSLAQELHADLVLLDDLEAREEAERLALAVMGTLRVLELASERGLLDFCRHHEVGGDLFSYACSTGAGYACPRCGQEKADVARMQTQSGMLALQGKDGRAYQDSAIYRAYLSRRRSRD